MIRSAGCSNPTSGSSPRQGPNFSSARTIRRISLSSGLASPSRFHACTSARSWRSRRGRTAAAKSAILGTNYTMTGPVYPGALGRRGIEWLIPDEADRKLIHDVIFDELCLGEFNESSRDAYVRIIEKMANQRMRRGRIGLHRNPVADHGGCLALAGPRIRRGCWRARRLTSRSARGQCRSGVEARSECSMRRRSS